VLPRSPFVCKIWFIIRLCISFVVFYTVNWYICVYMTCSTSYCLYDTILDPWNVCVCVCVCVRVCVCDPFKPALRPNHFSIKCMIDGRKEGGSATWRPLSSRLAQSYEYMDLYLNFRSVSLLWCWKLYFLPELFLAIVFSAFFYDSTATSWPGSPHCRGFTITLRHSTFGTTPLD